jgi:hypothetical protein
MNYHKGKQKLLSRLHGENVNVTIITTTNKKKQHKYNSNVNNSDIQKSKMILIRNWLSCLRSNEACQINDVYNYW